MNARAILLWCLVLVPLGLATAQAPPPTTEPQPGRVFCEQSVSYGLADPSAIPEVLSALSRRLERCRLGRQYLCGIGRRRRETGWHRIDHLRLWPVRSEHTRRRRRFARYRGYPRRRAQVPEFRRHPVRLPTGIRRSCRQYDHPKRPDLPSCLQEDVLVVTPDQKRCGNNLRRDATQIGGVISYRHCRRPKRRNNLDGMRRSGPRLLRSARNDQLRLARRNGLCES